MRTALVLGRRLVDQFEIGLMDEGRSVQGGLVLPAPPLPLRRLVQLVVDEGKERVEGSRVARPQIEQ
jgi:hypothetical protein